MKNINSLKGILARMIQGRGEEPVSPQYSYRIFWAKQALDWSLAKRIQLREELETIIQREDFEPNTYARRYRLDAFSGQKHAGASLLVLQDVLVDLERVEKSGGLE